MASQTIRILCTLILLTSCSESLSSNKQSRKQRAAQNKAKTGSNDLAIDTPTLLNTGSGTLSSSSTTSTTSTTSRKPSESERKTDSDMPDLEVGPLIKTASKLQPEDDEFEESGDEFEKPAPPQHESQSSPRQSPTSPFSRSGSRNEKLAAALANLSLDQSGQSSSSAQPVSRSTSRASNTPAGKSSQTTEAQNVKKQNPSTSTSATTESKKNPQNAAPLIQQEVSSTSYSLTGFLAAKFNNVVYSQRTLLEASPNNFDTTFKTVEERRAVIERSLREYGAKAKETRPDSYLLRCALALKLAEERNFVIAYDTVSELDAELAIVIPELQRIHKKILAIKTAQIAYQQSRAQQPQPENGEDA